MGSRVGLVAIGLVVAGIAVGGTAARTPPSGTAMFLVHQDMRLCPSPLCGGYWVALANGARTHCGDGTQQAHCYVSSTVDRYGRPITGVAEGALVRGAIEPGPRVGTQRLDQLLVSAAYTPAGKAAVSGGYYRIVDTGRRCIRAPCFSYSAGQVNGSSRVLTSSVGLAAAGASQDEVARAQAALRTKDGLYARGRFASTPGGGRTFRALRLYLRAAQPRA